MKWKLSNDCKIFTLVTMIIK